MRDSSEEIGDIARKQRIILYSCIIVLKQLSKLKERRHCLKSQIDVYFRPFYLMFLSFSHVSIEQHLQYLFNYAWRSVK